MPKHRDATKSSSKRAEPYTRKANAARDASADTSTTENEEMSLAALSENYMDHRDEVMQILLNLTKALKDEREFRQSLLKRLEALKSKQEAQEKTQKEQAEKIDGHDRTLSEVDENIADITSQWEADLEDMESHSEEKINEKFGQFVTRLDHVESGLQEMRRVQNAAVVSDPFQHSEDWDPFAGEDAEEIELSGTSTISGNPAQAKGESLGHVPGFIRNLSKKIKKYVIPR